MNPDNNSTCEPVAPSLTVLASQVAESQTFRKTRRHQDLLQFLATRPGGQNWKEAWIGHYFFGRPADYDPKADPVVRVEIRRLRERLQQYYSQEGKDQEWELDIPRGAYALLARPRRREAPAVDTKLDEVPPLESSLVEDADPRPALNKGKSRPQWPWVAVALIVVVCGVAWRFWAWNSKPPIRSVQILPMRIDPAAQMPGLGNEIAGLLNQAGGLTVIRDDRADANLIGEAKVYNGRIKLQLQLERNRDKSLIWAKTYDRDLVDPFSLQEELAVSTAMEIRNALNGLQRSKRQPLPESDREAKRGWKLLDRTSALGVKEALEAFRNAARLDPENANAWAGICDVIGIAPDYMASPPEWTAEGRAAGQRSLALDPENLEALIALGWLEYSRELRAARAEKMLKHALALNPDSVRIRRRLGLLWLGMGRFRQAEQQMRTAIQMEPLSLIGKINLAEVYSYEGEYSKVIRVLEEVLHAQPNYVLGRVMMASALSKSNRCREALEIVRLLREEPDAAGWEMPNLSIEVRCGVTKRARSYLNRAQNDPSAWTIAFELRQWPLTYLGLERSTRESPSSARMTMIGPDRKILMTYPPIARLIAQVDEKVARPD